jgi:hypothetical protein
MNDNKSRHVAMEKNPSTDENHFARSPEPFTRWSGWTSQSARIHAGDSRPVLQRWILAWQFTDSVIKFFSESGPEWLRSSLWWTSRFDRSRALEH